MNYQINNSVGSKGKNLPRDVKLVRALMNVYLRNANSAKSLPIVHTSDTLLESTIHELQKSKMKLTAPDSRVDPNGKTLNQLISNLNGTFILQPIVAPNYGILTWESEGMEGGPYHSRRLHVPSSSSGVTVGRGYDCSVKSPNKIERDLIGAGVPVKEASKIKAASGLRGAKAEESIIDNDLLDFQITPAAQLKLFSVTYNEELAEVVRISSKSSTIKAYGSVNWKTLNSYIKDMIVDLKFRGDYTPTSRKLVQVPLVKNDLPAIKRIMQNALNWPNVPSDRFKRRSHFMASAI